MKLLLSARVTGLKVILWQNSHRTSAADISDSCPSKQKTSPRLGQQHTLTTSTTSEINGTAAPLQTHTVSVVSVAHRPLAAGNFECPFKHFPCWFDNWSSCFKKKEISESSGQKQQSHEHRPRSRKEATDTFFYSTHIPLHLPSGNEPF